MPLGACRPTLAHQAILVRGKIRPDVVADKELLVRRQFFNANVYLSPEIMQL